MPHSDRSRNGLAVIVLAAGLATAAVAGSARAELPDQLPELGDTSSSIISPQLERKIGRDFLKQVNSGLPTISDPLLKHYTLRHMTKLAQHSELDDKLLSVALIDSPQINAFAAPGGVVGVNLGLMLAAEDVHEYSAVLAHELAHLSQRHFARGIEEQRAQALPNLAGLLAAVMIGALGGGEAGIAAISTAQAAAIVADSFRCPRCNVSRREITVRRVTSFQIIVAVAFRNFSWCSRLIGKLRHPDSSVVPQGFRHQRELGLTGTTGRNTCRVNLCVARISKRRAALVGAPDCGGIAAGCIRGQEENVAVATRTEDDRITEVTGDLPVPQIACNDAAGDAVMKNQIQHFRMRVHFHLTSRNLPIQRCIRSQQKLLAGLSAGVECPGDQCAAE